MMSEEVEQIRAAFRYFDSDRSGFLDREEFARIVRLNHAGDTYTSFMRAFWDPQYDSHALTDEEVELIFQQVDTNNDGLVDEEELIAWLLRD